MRNNRVAHAGCGPYETPANLDDILDEDSALPPPRMILVLSKLAKFRQAKARAFQRHRRSKISRNDSCPYAHAKNTNAVAAALTSSRPITRGIQLPLTLQGRKLKFYRVPMTRRGSCAIGVDLETEQDRQNVVS